MDIETSRIKNTYNKDITEKEQQRTEIEKKRLIMKKNIKDKNQKLF